MTAFATVDLPQPDSPASPRISPGAMAKLTRSAPRTARSSLTYSTTEFLDIQQRGHAAPSFPVTPMVTTVGALALAARRGLRRRGFVISSTA